MFALLGFGAGIVVQLNPVAATDAAAAPSAATAGIRFNTDGTVDKRESASYTQVNSATDWIIPNGAASSDYEVRYTGHSGDAFTTEAAAEDTWIALSSNRLWQLSKNTAGFYSCTCTFEIRKGTGATIDTALCTFTANVI
jgi:hypothetical protein